MPRLFRTTWKYELPNGREYSFTANERCREVLVSELSDAFEMDVFSCPADDFDRWSYSRAHYWRHVLKITATLDVLSLSEKMLNDIIAELTQYYPIDSFSVVKTETTDPDDIFDFVEPTSLTIVSVGKSYSAMAIIWWIIYLDRLYGCVAPRFKSRLEPKGVSQLLHSAYNIDTNEDIVYTSSDFGSFQRMWDKIVRDKKALQAADWMGSSSGPVYAASDDLTDNRRKLRNRFKSAGVKLPRLTTDSNIVSEDSNEDAQDVLSHDGLQSYEYGNTTPRKFSDIPV